MKLAALLFFAVLVAAGCSNQKKTTLRTGCYKGRLEVKAACMNYTISIIGGDIDTSLVVSTWEDPTTRTSYKNAFSLGSRCNFPERLNVGDEFYFMIDNTAPMNCAVCMIYYPVPPKQLSIKVLDQPCSAGQ